MDSRYCDLEHCLYNLEGICVNPEDCQDNPISKIEEKSIEKLDFKLDLSTLDLFDEEDFALNEEIDNLNL